MPFKGNTKALRQLTKQIRSLSSDRVRKSVIRAIGEECLTQVQIGFERGRAPDGTRWPQSLRARVQGGQTLLDTGRLRNSIRITYSAGHHGFSIGTNARYAAIHNYGGVIKPRGQLSGNFRVTATKHWDKKFNLRTSSKTNWSGRGSEYLTFRLPNGRWVKVKEVTIPRRQFLPYPGQMPRAWVPGIRIVVTAQINRVFGRR